MKKYAAVATAAIFMAIFTACSENYFFSSKVDIPNATWNSEKSAIFEPTFNDSLQSYDIILSVSNTEEYRYSNIWFFIKTVSPDGSWQKDTLEFPMAEESGKWIGKKQGDIWESKFYFKKQVRLSKTGKYTFEIQQGMRDLDLKGITSAGILIRQN